MKRTMIRTAAAAAALLMFAAGASADAFSVEGTVTSKAYGTPVFPQVGGTIEEIKVRVGQSVSEGEPLMSLRTTKVYAETDGTVSGIFGQPGDTIGNIKDRYKYTINNTNDEGAVMYIEPELLYTVTASTEYAYSSTETKTIHVGEIVYVRASSNQKRTGTARVTKVSGTKFMAEITEGEFITGEKAYVFRDSDFSRKLKLGYGEITRTNLVKVNGPSGSTSSSTSNTTTSGNSISSSSSGTTSSNSYSIVRIAVEEGQQVKRGDLLMELLSGEFDGLYASGSDVCAPCDGIIATITYDEGTSVSKSNVVATIYTQDSICVTAEIPEENLKDIREGDTVELSLAVDETHKYEGTVRMISGVKTEKKTTTTDSSGNTTTTVDDSNVSFTAWIDFTPDEAVRFGSTMLVEKAE